MPHITAWSVSIVVECTKFITTSTQAKKTWVFIAKLHISVMKNSAALTSYIKAFKHYENEWATTHLLLSQHLIDIFTFPLHSHIKWPPHWVNRFYFFLPLKSPLMPPIFFTICANLVYWVKSSWTSLVETPEPLATLWILPGCLLKTLAPSVLSSSAISVGKKNPFSYWH